MSEQRVLNPMREEQLQEWEALVRQQKASKLIGYEWAEKTRPLLNAVITLVSEVRALQAECARLAGVAVTAVQRAEDAGACVLALETTVAQLERQRDAARAALKRFGRHEPGCHNLRTYLNEPHTRPCNCGLRAAMEAK